MTDDDPHNDGDLFRWAWVALEVGLFALLAFGVYQWHLKVTVRPAVDVPAKAMAPRPDTLLS